VREGRAIGEGYNRRELDRDPFAHAELIALAQAARAMGQWRLTGVTLYATLDRARCAPGRWCRGRLTRLVLGANDPRAGAGGSLYNLLEDGRHNHRVQVTRGVLAESSSALLKSFFQALRAAED